MFSMGKRTALLRNGWESIVQSSNCADFKSDKLRLLEDEDVCIAFLNLA